eukprot:scaffold29527_cov74-Phaeocystis_antarctica.AAC.7
MVGDTPTTRPVCWRLRRSLSLRAQHAARFGEVAKQPEATGLEVAADCGREQAGANGKGQDPLQDPDE